MRLLEIAVIAVIVIAALAYIIARLLKTARGKQPACCPGTSSGKKKTCPHCSGSGCA